MGALLVDLRGAWRALRARRGFVAFSVVTLALAIGANAAIFSVVHAVLLRQLPYREPERLVDVQHLRTDGDHEVMAILDLEDYRAARGIELSGYTEVGVTLGGMGGDPERVVWARADERFFAVLGVEPALGRGFGANDIGTPVVVLSDALWRRRFVADPRVIGQAVMLNEAAHTVIGVLPAGFLFPGGRAELVVPLDLAHDARRPRRDANFLRVVGRLASGGTLVQANAELDSICARLAREHPENARKLSVVLTPIAEQLVGQFREMLTLLLGAVALVLLVACANLASLNLAAAAARSRQLALRVALGASPGRLVRQLVLESALVAGAGAGLGLLLASWGVDLLIAISPAQIPRMGSAGVDSTVLGFTAGVAAATVMLFGLAPALRAARAVSLASLLDGRAPAAPVPARARRVLVTVEVALSLGLLAMAGLLVRSFVALAGVDPGFEAANVLTLRVNLPAQRYPDRAALVRFQSELRGRFAALPGVVEAGSIQLLPLTGAIATVDFTIEGRPPPAANAVPQVHYRMIGPGSLRALGVPLVAGRDLTPLDGADAPQVVIINQQLARRYFPDGAAVGARLLLDDLGGAPRPVTIIGVAGDVRDGGLDGEPLVTIYVPLAQIPDGAVVYARNFFWMLRTGGDPLAWQREAVAALHDLDASLPAGQVQSLEQIISVWLAPRRFDLVLVLGFALVAMCLAGLGIYALTSQLASGRTRELGIRMALGARPRELVWRALLDGLAPALIGVVAGMGAAVALGRLAAGRLFQVAVVDPLSLGAAAVVLVACGFVAAWLPARRVARVDPASVLRECA